MVVKLAAKVHTVDGRKYYTLVETRVVDGIPTKGYAVYNGRRNGTGLDFIGFVFKLSLFARPSWFFMIANTRTAHAAGGTMKKAIHAVVRDRNRYMNLLHQFKSRR